MSFWKKATITAVLTAMAIPLQAIPGWAEQNTFYVGDPSKRDVVSFDSDAPVELIKGTTNKIKGHVTYDKEFKFDTKHPFEIVFDVDLASIDTGIPLRNQHMRDNFLQTAKYPKAVFKARQIKTRSKHPMKSGQVVKLTAIGDLTIHGKTVPKTIPLTVTYFPESAITKKRFKSGNMIRIRANFPVKLAQHNIQRPEALFVKLAEEVIIKVDAFATDDKTALK
ncbi:MAG: YceI family protein [Vampirovibrio sp.]|nr:YceI family protein [Vampirovibrio sp.]